MEYNQTFKPLIDCEKGDYEKKQYEKTDYDHCEYDLKKQLRATETKKFPNPIPFPNGEQFYGVNVMELHYWIQELIYRATPRNVSIINDFGMCNNCYTVLGESVNWLNPDANSKFCPRCGQALKWPVKK